MPPLNLQFIRSMSFSPWQELTPNGQRLSRYIVCESDEPVIGAGFGHPRRAEGEGHREAQVAEPGPIETEIHQRRS